MWGLKHEGTTFKGGNNPNDTWGEFERLQAIQELRLEPDTAGKFSVSRMTMDPSLLLYVLLPRKRNHEMASEEDILILWAMSKEKQINWPYLMANRMVNYSHGLIFEASSFDLSREKVVVLGKANAITRKNIN
ncbi:hypothetical protein PIB30_082274 [Stylosanthes scabra]|uniref:Uncharacterized protein n=1 Tax=Stylosanthes scabra TaxID=79078 RepID=A0ABU6WRM1_9FABA|nr:hypothetical protein [Stylosanthes scabra]